MTLPSHVDHLVVGAGFAGVALAIGLQDDGEEFLVIDKADGLGGTWWDNTYPGATCDVPSQLYSFSFAPNPDWSPPYSPQPEIQAYLEKVAADAGVLDRFHFGVELLGRRVGRRRRAVAGAYLGGRADLHHADQRHRRALGAQAARHRGHRHLRRATCSTPPEWDHVVDLAGKRVAVIGTGASAIQVVPAIQPVVGHLDVYQRSAPWVLPKGDRAFTDKEKRLFRRFPSAAEGAARPDLLVPRGAGPRHHAAAAAERPGRDGSARMNLARGVKDPALRERLTPTFGVFCKRILLSDDYYPAMASRQRRGRHRPDREDHALAVWSPPTASSARSTCSSWPPASTRPTRRSPTVIRGRDGRTLAETWAATGMAAYKGCGRARLPQPALRAGPQHRPGPHLGAALHRGGHRLRPRRAPHHAAPATRHDRAESRRRRPAGTPTSSAG